MRENLCPLRSFIQISQGKRLRVWAPSPPNAGHPALEAVAVHVECFQWEQWSLTNCHNKVIELQLISLQIIHSFCSSITCCTLSRHQCLLLFLMQTRMITEVAISMQSQMLGGFKSWNISNPVVMQARCDDLV